VSSVRCRAITATARTAIDASSVTPRAVGGRGHCGPGTPPAMLSPAILVRARARRGGMGRWQRTEGLTDVQEEILKTVRAFVEAEILPVATELEHKDQYPTAIVEGLKELGLFGLMIPEEYGGRGRAR